MEKIEYIRALSTGLNSVILIFRVLIDCNLSELKLVFGNTESLQLPNVKVTKGDFVWITNMDNEEVDQIISENSSRTNTLILRTIDKHLDLASFNSIKDV